MKVLKTENAEGGIPGIPEKKSFTVNIIPGIVKMQGVKMYKIDL